MSMRFGGSQTWVQALTLCDLGHITYNEHEVEMFRVSTLETVAVRMEGDKMSGSTVPGTQSVPTRCLLLYWHRHLRAEPRISVSLLALSLLQMLE